MRGIYNLIMLTVTLGMIIFAVPRLEIGNGWTAPTLFGTAWILFALLIVASHLYSIMRVDEETHAELVKIKRYRRRQMGMYLERKLSRRNP